MKCRCYRPLDAERIAAGFKYCPTCCKKSGDRAKRLYRERLAAGLCYLCREPRDGDRKTTCTTCRDYLTSKRRAMKEAA